MSKLAYNTCKERDLLDVSPRDVLTNAPTDQPLGIFNLQTF